MERLDRHALLAWLALVVLTLATYAAGRTGLAGPLVVAGILLSVLAKGQMIADLFMGLNGVRNPWRWMVTAWLVFVLVMIGVAFAVGEN